MHAIATVSLNGDLIDKLVTIAAAGFDGVEIFEPDIHESRATPREIGRRARALGLEIISLQPFRDVEASGNLMRQLDRLEMRFALMNALGTRLLIISSNTSRHTLDDSRCAVGDLRIIAERAHCRGYRIGFEALAWGTHIHDYRDAWNIVQRVNHPALGLVLDSFHAQVRREPLDTLSTLPAEKIFLVQLADALWYDDITMIDWSGQHRCLPGMGMLGLDAFIAALNVTGYSGPLSLEVSSPRDATTSPYLFAQQGKRTLEQASNKPQKTDEANNARDRSIAVEKRH
ncbi:sugar phosphate isomerase/epimerase family protein [Phytohalomonas tamaricis]|uniref:sugar phosphate isomerase/epimerase family protein n=1 Tax=Phytohalomonas tamaricis TaxID=2081032 RepID=UPI000D0B1F01|nr:sugar phosphate isomerase/epimerase [Phytohalomonas tamaricis]